MAASFVQGDASVSSYDASYDGGGLDGSSSGVGGGGSSSRPMSPTEGMDLLAEYEKIKLKASGLPPEADEVIKNFYLYKADGE